MVYLTVEQFPSNLNCGQCKHAYRVHEFDESKTNSLLRVGKCLVPGCDCRQYVDRIRTIDEDLL